MKDSLMNWAKKHVFGLAVSFVAFCFGLGLIIGIGISMADDAPGAILIFGGITLIGSSLISGMLLAIARMVTDMEKKLEK